MNQCIICGYPLGQLKSCPRCREEILKIAKPILFNGEMVRAILEDRKSVTRRLIRGFIPDKAEFGYTAFTPKNHISCRGYVGKEYAEKFFKLPYQVGDHLYVRETWGRYPVYNGTSHVYKADCIDDDNLRKATELVKRWKPSIHMPKELARIFLKVTNVWVERVQDLTEEQGLKEGVSAFMEFAYLWNNIYGSKGYSWDANPWVFVIEFEKIEIGD